MFDATRDGDRPRRRNAAAEGKGCHAPGMAAKGGRATGASTARAGGPREPPAPVFDATRDGDRPRRLNAAASGPSMGERGRTGGGSKSTAKKESSKKNVAKASAALRKMLPKDFVPSAGNAKLCVDPASFFPARKKNIP